MIKQPELGQNIREARTTQGISIVELCKSVGICQTTLYSIEDGTNNAKKPTLDSICRTLNISPDTLEPFESAWDDFPKGKTINSGAYLAPTSREISDWKNKYEKEIREIPKK